MTVLLKDPVKIIYNGVEFQLETRTESVSIKPVLDSARRTVVFAVYSFTLRATLFAPNPNNGDTTDALLVALRNQLTKQGQTFIYEGTGLGAFAINTATADVRWGPIPTELSWVPKGGNAAGEIVFKIEVAISECGTNLKLDGLRDPMEMCYDLTYSEDTSGYSTRDYVGHIIIPQTRLAPDLRVVQDSADRLRESVNAQTPTGFRREVSRWHLDQAKCKLEFSIRDTQMPAQVRGSCREKRRPDVCAVVRAHPRQL